MLAPVRMALRLMLNVAWESCRVPRERVRLVAGAADRDRADRGDLPGHGGRDLDVHARIAGLAGEQVRYRAPVPGRGDGAVHQKRAVVSRDLRGRQHAVREHLADRRAARPSAGTPSAAGHAGRPPARRCAGVMLNARPPVTQVSLMNEPAGDGPGCLPAKALLLVHSYVPRLPSHMAR
jgi:hypothetical protein